MLLEGAFQRKQGGFWELGGLPERFLRGGVTREKEKENGRERFLRALLSWRGYELQFGEKKSELEEDLMVLVRYLKEKACG